MNARRLNFILYGLAGCFAAAGLGIAAWGVLHAPQAIVPAHPNVAHSGAGLGSTERPPSLDELQAAFRIDLRRPLVDPPPALPPIPPPAAGLGLKLMGTIVEPGHCRAMLQTADGKLELKGIGENCRGAQILDIGLNSVTLSYEGKTLTLGIEKKQGS
jgi:hypothetical protein